MDHYNELREALSESILGKPYDGAENLPEIQKIDALTFMAREYAMGVIELEELVAGYSGIAFDIRQWVATMEAQGTYAPHREDPNAP